MRTTVIIATGLALVAACPSNWENPCIISDDSTELGPKDGQWCSTSSAGYIGKLGDGGHNYINTGGVNAGLSSSDSALNIPTNGRVQGLYSNGGLVYIQECSNACVNHPTCTSFSFRSNENAQNEPSTWRDDALGNGAYGILRGDCYLYSHCDESDLSNDGNRKQWWLGTGSNGVCQIKTNLDDYCANDNTCVTECPAGQKLGQDSNGKNECQDCAHGYYKQGTNAQTSCTECPTCSDGTYSSVPCTTTSPTQCVAHGSMCPNTDFELFSGTGTADRACEACSPCGPGTEIDRGCHVIDPWVGQSYASDAAGAAFGYVSVRQVPSIAGKTVVVHGSDGTKVACGVLGGSGPYTAQITKLPSYTGAVDVTGTFVLEQHTHKVKGQFSLAGLETSSTGMFHVHAGTSCSAVGAHLLNPSTGGEMGNSEHSHRRLAEMGHPGESEVTVTTAGKTPVMQIDSSGAVPSTGPITSAAWSSIVSSDENDWSPTHLQAAKFTGSTTLAQLTIDQSSNNVHWFFALKSDSTGAYHNLFDSQASSSMCLWVDDASKYEFNNCDNSEPDTIVTTDTVGEWQIVQASVIGGATNKLRVGNDIYLRPYGNDNMASSVTYDLFKRGSGQKFEGLVGEVIVYNQALSDDEQDEIVEALQAKWISGGDAKCVPCVPGVSFANGSNNAKCVPVTVCANTEYVSVAGTVTADQSCTPCPVGHECNGISKNQCQLDQYVLNNACTACPAGSVCDRHTATPCQVYQHVVSNACVDCNTKPAQLSDYLSNTNCDWQCHTGYDKTDSNQECAQAGPKLSLTYAAATSQGGRLVSYPNGVLKFDGFKCVDDDIKFCGASSQVSFAQLEARLASVESRLAALEA